jgi:CO dehydrogenase nickel-insertion accessory protein CooC1
VESPPATLADIRDSTPLNAQQIRQLPPGVSPVQFVFDKLKHEGVIASRQIREMNFDLLVMGHPQGLGCYCSVEATRTSSNITVHCVSRHFTSGPSSASSFWAVAKSNH